jgi:apolipoprotein N-acyltransferase
VRSFCTAAALNLAAITAGSLLFAAAFPNPLFPEGLAFLAWIAYVPVFWVIRRVGIGAAALWGGLYGYVSYSLFAPWLRAFHPLAGIAVSILQLCWMALLFPLLKLALILYPRRGYILQWLIWLGYEYLRTLGFLGHSYGISGYTQWSFLPLIQIASVSGVWGVSALVVFPSAYLAGTAAGVPGAAPGAAFFRRERVPGLIWALSLGAALAFGLPIRGNAVPAAGPEARIVLIQQNADPWREDARKALETLTGLSQKALAAGPAPDLVVWPETAFVPRIYWHERYRDNAESYALVRELLDFLEAQETPFLIGNDDARLEVNPGGRWDRVDYNGALLFEGAEIKGVYRKTRLVPFAEYFPYEKAFPRLYRALVQADTHFWKPGAGAVVFELEKTPADGGMGRNPPARPLRFAVPICFEDTFGYLSREFTRRGAELIVNLSNDAWSASLSCQTQHLAMAVFRAVENRRSMVRATASGQTCAIDPRGRITAMAEPFTAAFLNVRLPLLTTLSPYTRWGDWLGIFFASFAGMLLLTGTIRGILGWVKTGRKI